MVAGGHPWPKGEWPGRRAGMDGCEQTSCLVAQSCICSWELLPLRENAPSATQLQSQLSFCLCLQGIKTGHCEEAVGRWRREGPVPCLHLLL